MHTIEIINEANDNISLIKFDKREIILICKIPAIVDKPKEAMIKLEKLVACLKYFNNFINYHIQKSYLFKSNALSTEPNFTYCLYKLVKLIVLSNLPSKTIFPPSKIVAQVAYLSISSKI